ncbi:dienelactone hydrolase family protein [Streptomyces sp. SID11385]|uniref:dienelactone hydrolase family protein n=1 Tax=Streptomyces sp. SID11385 TaxID=2706031 RepID=UPI0013CCB155|nr:dienelactone hydrolase family protein [Streptomyces sp. SID11385]NEA42986.1 dienelactone hydrolase family protein [Streptomyces sp. SID11385]
MPTKTLSIATEDGHAEGFAAFPEGGGPHPGVLMYTDGFGLRPVIRDLAGELAGHGYYVLVPHLFYRHGPAPVVELPAYLGEDERAAVFARVMPLIEAHTAERARRDAAAYLAFLAARSEVAAGPFAVTGYCVGGLLAVRAAAAHPAEVAAVAAFHAPVGAAGPAAYSELRARVHLGHAEGDMTDEALGALHAELDTAGVDYTSEVYPGTRHGFTMSDTDAFSAAGLARHWDRLLPLLAGTRGRPA